MQRTFTSKLSNMPGTQRSRYAADASRGRIWQGNCDAADQLADSNHIPLARFSRSYDIASRDSADINPIRAIPLPNQGRFLQIVVSQASSSLARRGSSYWVACDTTLRLINSYRPTGAMQFVSRNLVLLPVAEPGAPVLDNETHGALSET